MSGQVVARVAAAHRALGTALETGSASEIEAATHALSQALTALRAVCAWHAAPELKGVLVQALREGEGARVRARYLAEHGRNRLERLLALRGRAPVGYERTGRYRAI